MAKTTIPNMSGDALVAHAFRCSLGWQVDTLCYVHDECMRCARILHAFETC